MNRLLVVLKDIKNKCFVCHQNNNEKEGGREGTFSKTGYMHTWTENMSMYSTTLDSII